MESISMKPGTPPPRYVSTADPGRLHRTGSSSGKGLEGSGRASMGRIQTKGSFSLSLKSDLWWMTFQRGLWVITLKKSEPPCCMQPCVLRLQPSPLHLNGSCLVTVPLVKCDMRFSLCSHCELHRNRILVQITCDSFLMAHIALQPH